MSVVIIPTIVPDSLADVGEVSARYASFTSFFQIDVADGKFAPNTTWLPKEGDALPQGFEYEVHMMVADPALVGRLFAAGGARTLIAHIETLGSAEKAQAVFKSWRTAGAQKIGLAVLLQTPFESAAPYLPYVDFVLLMTIASIGVQGIPYEPEAPARIAQFHARYPEITIAVDGGVSEKNIEELARAGATRFGVGSAIAKAADSAAAYRHLKELAESAAL